MKMNIDYVIKDKMLKMLDDPITMDFELFKRFLSQFNSVCIDCRSNFIVKCTKCEKLDCYYCNYNRTIFKCEYCDIYYCYTCNYLDEYLVKCSKLCSNRYHCNECCNLDICRECSTIKLIDFESS